LGNQLFLPPVAVRPSPPPSLVESLGKLGLASPGQIESVAGRVRRLVRDLPGFEFVWVDALAQARILTPYQASEINAGRGAALAVGPYTLCEPLEALGYATVYRARDSKTRNEVRLALIPARSETTEAWPAQFEALKRRVPLGASSAAASIESWGQAGSRFWVACRHVAGRSTADWLLHHGRLPPPIVEELARQMCAVLAECERAQIVYGDLSPRQIVLAPGGTVVLPMPGLRPIVRPVEGYADAGLLPEVYDYIAPERIAQGSRADFRSDLYACGAVWWHLLAGRPPIAGASGLAKLRGVQTQKIVDIQQLAPETSPRMAKAIARCLDRTPAKRPRSFAELADMLAAAPPDARGALARSMRQQQAPVSNGPTLGDRSWLPSASKCLIGLAGLLLILTVATWPQWGAHWMRRDAASAAPAKSALLVSHRQPVAVPAKEPVAPPPIARQPDARPQTRLTGSGREELRLPAGRTVKAHELTLRSGATISGGEGRGIIEVPATGWKINLEGLTFENIDFVRHAVSNDQDLIDSQPLVVLSAGRAVFQGCSWQVTGPENGRAVAIAWHPQGAGSDNDTLVTGKVVLRDCLLRGVAAGVRCAGRSTLVLELENTLHLGPGALVQLEHPPLADEALLLSAAHVTLRDARALIECALLSDDRPCGKISVAANDCAFVPAAGAGLLTFVGTSDPGRLVEQLEWTGQGSVLAPQTPLAVWQTADGQIKATADDHVQVFGLVHSHVEFAGAKDGAPAASQVIRWQVPLQSTDPPGIRENFSLLPATRR
jgi:serine/threonine-protein kinase